jgi:hypothetical protein
MFYGTTTNWKIAATGDFNGDGKDDLLWYNTATGQVYETQMNGMSVLGEGFVYSVADPNWQVVGSGDYNGDGKADILWHNSATGQSYMLLMNGLSVTSESFVYGASTAWKIIGP